jgi:NADPH-dependent 2,4-dienoyl-CoA reductase/sulfur reductase-like enzyme
MTRVLIVGAGPAGIRAAQALVSAGVHPVVVDEGARAGGQIYRRPPLARDRPAAQLYGSEAAKAQALHQGFDALVAGDKVEYRPETSVLALQGGRAMVAGPQGGGEIAFDRLILATGATDRLAPVPGWQAAGVFSLGAAQIALKAQGVALGRRVVLAGAGPLLTLVAHQLIRAGAEVAAVLETAPLRDQFTGGLAMALARPVVTARGVAMRAGLGRRYRAGVRLDRIVSGPDGVAALEWRDAGGRGHVTACDTVAMGWHLRAETALADLAGVAFDWSDLWQQWLPRADAMGRAGPGLYLAGDGLTLQGADAAECAGRLAAAACLADLGLPAPDPGPDLRRMARLRRFAAGVARAFPWPTDMVRALPDAAVVCRCEGITAGAIRDTLPLAGPEANRLKSLARPGMGRCQGRFCAGAMAEIAAHAAGCPPQALGRLRGQAPVRPVTAGALARLDPDA